MPPDRRRRLLTTSAEEFSESGYEHASLNRIIRSCGMSKSSFSHYFDSKRDLFDLVVDEVSRNLATALDVPAPESFASDAFWEDAAALLDRLLALDARDPTRVDLGRLFSPAGPLRGTLGAPAPTDHRGTPRLAGPEPRRWPTRGRRPRRPPPDLQVRLTLAVLTSFDEWVLGHRSTLDREATRTLGHGRLAALTRLLAPS